MYDYIRERGTILPIHEYSQELLSKDDVHKRVAESIRSGKGLAGMMHDTALNDSDTLRAPHKTCFICIDGILWLDNTSTLLQHRIRGLIWLTHQADQSWHVTYQCRTGHFL